MSELFEQSSADMPLAEQFRPKHIDDVIGQKHLLGEGAPLKMAFDSKKPHSMIFWGPPGVGKTTLARITATTFEHQFIAISAVLGGVKEIREAIDLATHYQAQQLRCILFIDEIHRFNKAQQDALLPHVESGLFVLIGATTENPSFEVNSALLSRATVYVLKPLTDEDLALLFERVQKKLFPHLSINPSGLSNLIGIADGDARKLLNVLEQIVHNAEFLNADVIDDALIKTVISHQSKRFDKSGEYFYDQISALHKSVRGSNPDAALYWLCRMLDGGVSPKYLTRRIIRMAWEDIGLADPRAMQIANDAAATYERLGSPEGELAIAQALIYLAVAPKSNAGYLAYNAAKAFVEQDKSRDVPLHLRNAPTRLMKALDYGKAYRYAHDEPDGYAAGEHYLPDDMKNPHWYAPVNRGLEIKIREKLQSLKQKDDLYLKQSTEGHPNE